MSLDFITGGYIPNVLARVGITRLCSAAVSSWTIWTGTFLGDLEVSYILYLYTAQYRSMAIVLSKAQDLALTIYLSFTYFTCCQVEIHGPARSSDALRVKGLCTHSRCSDGGYR